MNKSRILQILFVLIFFIVVLASPIVVFMIWNYPPKNLVIQSDISNEEVPRGGTMSLVGYIVVPSGCDIIIFRSIYDSQGIKIGVLNETILSMYTDNTVKFSRELRIPDTAALGVATVHRVIQWSCNWPQALFPNQSSLASLEFMITAPQPE